MYKLKKKSGQSTVEYILLVTAVIVILIFFLVSGNSPFKQKYNETLNIATSGMQDMANRLATSRPLAP